MKRRKEGRKAVKRKEEKRRKKERGKSRGEREEDERKKEAPDTEKRKVNFNFWGCMFMGSLTEGLNQPVNSSE